MPYSGAEPSAYYWHLEARYSIRAFFGEIREHFVIAGVICTRVISNSVARGTCNGPNEIPGRNSHKRAPRREDTTIKGQLHASYDDT